MRLLALDLATATGWACGTFDRPVSHGVFKAPKTGQDIGRFLAYFRKWLGEAIEQMGPTEILFESPILTGIKNLTTLRKLYSLAGVAELVAFDYELPIAEANLSSIRVHFVGMRCAPKAILGKEKRRQWIKARTVAECRKRGFRVADDNDADALALMSYGLSLKQKGFTLQAVTERVAA